MNLFVWQCRSRSDFLCEAELRATENVLMETAPIRMSPTDFKAFLEVLSQPPQPVPEMVELFQRVAPWESREAKAEK